MFRDIVHIGISNFCAAVEELRRPELKKRPLVLAEPGERSIIQGVNGIARKEGLFEGMPLSRARRICRRIQVVPSDYYYYRERHREIVREFARFSPLVEGTSPGGYFIDITGTRRLWGPGPDTACLMEKEIAGQMGLHSRIGLASNKLVSQVAANCTDAGDLSFIFPGNEEPFLAPLPLRLLPGVGQVTLSRLAGFNVQKIGELASFSLDMLSGVFGGTAGRLLKIARGIDPAPVLPSRRTQRFSMAKVLDRDEIDLARLELILFRQVEEAGWALRRNNRRPGQLRMEIRYADGMSVEARKKLHPQVVESDRLFFRSILPLFHKLFCRRVAIRRMILEFYDLAMPFSQLSFFTWEKDPLRKENTLQTALDGIREKFGKKIISYGWTGDG